MKLPRASLICIGSELLAGQVNTHQAWLSLRLRAKGFQLVGEASVPDHLSSIVFELKKALRQSEVVIVCGGLGPTFDDITREACAKALGRPLHFVPTLWRDIQRRFKRYHRTIPEENKRQAYLISGGQILPNPNGSAPGQLILSGQKTLVLLPGPPAEMYPMFLEKVLPKLVKNYCQNIYPVSVCVNVFGVPESIIDETLNPVRSAWPKLEFTILAKDGKISFHARGFEHSKKDAQETRLKLRKQIISAVGQYSYSEDDMSLEELLGQKLKHLQLTIAVAESCSAGLLSSALTSIAGSSEYFLGGIIAYHNSVKINTLKVSAQTLKRYGAVSSQCAIEMACGAKKNLRSDVALSITGIAGPGGGTTDKPVGLVFLGLAGPRNQIKTLKLQLAGSRDNIRKRAVTAALLFAYNSIA